jgi:uncharacterized protein (DUF58 family)
MSSLLTRVKSKIFISSYKKAIHALEGEYISIMRGRSMDFEDLRGYAAGDDVKDIDWKASARHQSPLVKQYIATRKQPVMFIVDSGRNMNAITQTGETKKDLAITAMGVLGYLAIRHSDTVGLIIGDKNKTKRIPNKETESHLERLLQNVDANATLDSEQSDIVKQLRYLQANVKSRCLVVIIADDAPLGSELDGILIRLQAQHEVLWVSLNDGDPLNQVKVGEAVVRDIGTGEYIPDYIRKNKKLRKYFETHEVERKHSTEQFLNRIGVSNVSISSNSEVIPKLLKLLERRIRVRRR